MGKHLCWSLLNKVDTYFEEHLPNTAFALHTHHSLLLIHFALYSATSSHHYRYCSESTHLEVFDKKPVLRHFAKFTGKHLCQSFFFNKLAGLRHATLLKKSL